MVPKGTIAYVKAVSRVSQKRDKVIAQHYNNLKALHIIPIVYCLILLIDNIELAPRETCNYFIISIIHKLNL